MKTTSKVFAGLSAIACLNGCGSLARRANVETVSSPQNTVEQTPALSLKEELTGKSEPASSTEKEPSSTVNIPSMPPATMQASSATTDQSEIQVTLKKNGKEITAPSPKNVIAHTSDEALPAGMVAQPKNLVIEPGGPVVPQTSIAPLASGITATHFEAPRTGVAAEKALNWLKNGNRRFTKGYFRKDGQSMKDVRHLVSSQKPHTIILACSDSRVPPEIIFDQKLGEIFVVRTFGPSLDQAVLTSIEHAVSSLGTNLILVMGHNSCEAHPDETDNWNPINLVARELEDKSAVIRAAEGSGLRIQSAIYDINSGIVTFK